MRWAEIYGQTDRLVPVNGLDAVASRLVWDVYEARVIRDEWGNPLGFCAIDKRRDNQRRNMLPNEFFNHELDEIDIHDVEALAAFMSEYGFLGRYFSTTPTTFQNINRLDSSVEKNVDRFEAITHFAWQVDDEYGDYFEELAPGFYRLLWDGLKRIDDTLNHQQRGLPFLKRAHICGLASIERVVETIKKWRSHAAVIESTIKHGNIATIARELNLDIDLAYASLDRAVHDINTHLSSLSPTIEIYDETINLPLMFSAPNRDAVGLEEALAVQLWSFSLEAKEGYSICKECGRMFVRKRSKRSKVASRSTSQFCCDKCKNRNAQRRHRKTPGYLLKRASQSSK